MKTLALLLVGLTLQANASDFWNAVKTGQESTVRSLISRTPSLKDSKDADGLPAVQVAAGRGKLGALKALVEAGANLHQPGPMDVSVLHKGVYSGNPEVVEYLLHHGASVNAVSPSNAIYFRSPKGERIIRALIAAGANLDFKNQAGLVPLDSAWAVKYPAAIRLLQGLGHHTLAGQRLRETVLANDIPALEALLAKTKQGLGERDENGFTPLILAARTGLAKEAEVLLQNGADANQLDLWMGANAGHKAAYWGRASVIPVLFAHGWKPDERGGYNGYTALHDAVAGSHVDTVRELLKGGARFDIEGHDGKTALSLARELGNSEVLALFP